MKKRLQLIACIALTLFMHFLLPYAALAEEMGTIHHGPPKPDHHPPEDIEGHSIHELPHHIEPKENELEEVEEMDEYVELIQEEKTSTKEKTPIEALFVYLCSYYARNNAPHPLSTGFYLL